MRAELSPLTGLDLQVKDYHICHAFFFDRHLDESAMERSLTKIIEELPEISGRLIFDAGKYFILMNNAGIKFEACSVNRSIKKVADDELYAYGEPIAKSAANKDEPLFKARITQFTDGAILCINRSHALCDGGGLFGLLARWARHCRGAPPLPPMSFDRGSFIIMEEAFKQTGRKMQGEIRKEINQSINKKEVFNVRRMVGINLKEFEKLKKKIHEGDNDQQWVSTRDLIVAKFIKTLSFYKSYGQSIRLSSVNTLRGGPVDRLYFGNAHYVTREKYRIEDLRSDSLMKIAKKHRSFLVSDVSDKAIDGWGLNAREETVETELLVNDLSKFPISEINFGVGLPYSYIPGPTEPSGFVGVSSAPPVQNILTILPTAYPERGILKAIIYLTDQEMDEFIIDSSREEFFIPE